MVEERDINQNKKQNANSKEHINPDYINSKEDLPDTRERRDGPGGN